MQGSAYRSEHEASSEARFQRARMPRTLEGAMRWLLRMADAELPTALHTGDTSQVWRDRVSLSEFEDGVKPLGGSHLGTLPWNGLFRVFLEGSPSATDEEGFYLFPLRAALSRLHRRHAIVARDIVALIGYQGDWQAWAVRNGMHVDRAEVYLAEALHMLWTQTHEQTVRRVA